MGTKNSVFKYRFKAANACRAISLVLALVSCGAADAPADPPAESATEPPAAAPAPAPGAWSGEHVTRLLDRARAVTRDALPVPDLRELEAAKAAGDQPAIDRAATALALRIARMNLFGIASTAERAGWHVADTDGTIDIEARLREAVAGGQAEAFLDGLLPEHPDYAALRTAYAAETDPERRAKLARNLERWRWMPRSLGPSYVLVNTASFEASLWRAGKRAGTWRVVVGKPSTPSPVFAARITGVTFNPWWEIPASIVREKHGNFPASQGYVRTASGFRQKPGPSNALGQMKLVMPNPYSVYMHDTPSKSLFDREVRAFSHGCIRVRDPMDFATVLLDGSRSRAQVDAIVASRKTTTIDLPRSLPVYVTYFTATVRGDGILAFMPDIYGRDARSRGAAEVAAKACAA